jgi:NADH dehydrogenase
MENVKKNAIPMKTLNDAIVMRNVENLEKAAICKRHLRTPKIINDCCGWRRSNSGWKFPNVLKCKHLLKEYPELSTTASNIYLVDGANAVLSPMSTAESGSIDKIRRSRKINQWWIILMTPCILEMAKPFKPRI